MFSMFLCSQIHVTEKYNAMLHSPRPQTTSPISFTRTGRGTKTQKSLPLPISMVFYASYSWTSMIYIKTSSAGCLLCFFVVVDIFVLVNLVSFLNNLLRRRCSAFLQIRRLQFLQRPAPHCEAAWKVLIAQVKWFQSWTMSFIAKDDIFMWVGCQCDIYMICCQQQKRTKPTQHQPRRAGAIWTSQGKSWQGRETFSLNFHKGGTCGYQQQVSRASQVNMNHFDNK